MASSFCKDRHEYVAVIFNRLRDLFKTMQRHQRQQRPPLLFPSHTHLYQVGKVDDHLFSQLKQLSGVSESRATPYHLMGKGWEGKENITANA